MDTTQIIKILETIGIAAILLVVYHFTMKAGKKSIERREAEEKQKEAAKARQREQIREAVEYSRQKMNEDKAEESADK